MPVFERRGANILDHEGVTREVDIRFSNDAHLVIFDGYGPVAPGRHPQFRMKFSNDANDGWIVNSRCLDELVAELLYIKAEFLAAMEAKGLDGDEPEF